MAYGAATSPTDEYAKTQAVLARNLAAALAG